MKPIGLSIPSAANTLGGLSRATIYRMIARKELEAVKIGTRTLVTVSSIEAYVARAPRLAEAA